MPPTSNMTSGLGVPPGSQASQGPQMGMPPQPGRCSDFITEFLIKDAFALLFKD